MVCDLSCHRCVCPFITATASVGATGSRQPRETPRTATAKICVFFWSCQIADWPISAILPSPEITPVTPIRMSTYIPFLATHLRGFVASCLLQGCLHQHSGVGRKVRPLLKAWRGQNDPTSGLARLAIAAHSFAIVAPGWGCTARRYWQGNRSCVCDFWWGDKD